MATSLAAPAAAQTPPGVLVVGQIAEPKSLDPAAVNDFRILVNLHEGLLQYKQGTLEVAPSLATEWSVSDDGTEYTFTLREGVSFHDGTPFDAEAVKFNFDRMLNEDHPYHDTGPFPLAFAWANDENLAPYPHDPEKAKALLAEAGVAEGTRLVFYVTEGGSGMLDPVPMGTAIQADLNAVGFDVKIETCEWNTFLGEVNPGLEGKADMAKMAWMTNDPDTLPFLALCTAAWPDQGGFNSGHYSNPEVDALLEAAQTLNDQAERADLYRQMQRIVQADAPWVFVANWKQNAVTSDKV